MASQESAERQPAIVAIGASAGGFDAARRLLASLPAHTGMIFVLLQHLAPNHPSMLAGLLAHAMRMPAEEAKEGAAPQADHVYIMPPGTNLIVRDNRFHLAARGHAPQQGIDIFMRSLAEEAGSAAIGVVLSGTASDGTQGLAAIKAEGGITFAQSEQTAEYPAMPHNAIASGAVDFVLAPEEIAQQLMRLAFHPALGAAQASGGEAAIHERRYKAILELLRLDTGVDFNRYKSSTIRRRIARRMAMKGASTISAYLAFLRENPGEVKQLFEDLLISATSFFRDPAVWKALQTKVIPQILSSRPRGRPIRAWSIGCSTGEEVYSLAIALLESMAAEGAVASLQLFGTDLSEKAIDRARAGQFSPEIAGQISPERLARFFVKNAHGYAVNKAVRDICIFSRHNALREPPFSRLDLVLCRNVLIYMEAGLQNQIMPTLHYALNAGGFLVLGTSEGTTLGGKLFATVDREHKIFGKQSQSAIPPIAPEPARKSWRGGEATLAPVISDAEARQEADRVLLAEYTLPGVVVDANLEILQFRGHTSRYLSPAPGTASLNLLKMAHGELAVLLRGAVEQARRSHAKVRREEVHVPTDGAMRRVTVEVTPLRGGVGRRSLYLIVFDEPRPPAPVDARLHGKAERGEIARLKQALASGAETMRALIEEYEAAKEEFQAANEEVASANEELQSTNEELETSKEELQSTNEELNTVNDELRHRNLELHQANNDLNNLLAAVELPMVMVDRELRIRRFSPTALQMFHIMPADLGRRLGDVRPKFDFPGLDRAAVAVVATGETSEHEIRDDRGHWRAARLHPYRTSEQGVEGVVIAFFDIDALKRGGEQARSGRDVADAIVAATRQPLLVLDEQFRVSRANEAFHAGFRQTPRQIEGELLWRIGGGILDLPELRAALGKALEEGLGFGHFETTRFFGGARRRLILSGRRIDVGRYLLLLGIEDATAREREVRRAAAADQIAALSHIANTLGHEVNNPLHALRQALFVASSQEPLPPAAQRSLQAALGQVERMTQFSRQILKSPWAEPARPSYPAAALERALLELGPALASRQVEVARRMDATAVATASPTALDWLFASLLEYLITDVNPGCRLSVRTVAARDAADPSQRGVRITLATDGPGTSQDRLEAMLAPGAAADARRAASLNLWIDRALVEQYGGTLRARGRDKAGGHGTVFSLFLPLEPVPQPRD